MHQMALTDPQSPPLAELLRHVPSFISLPEESNACLAHLRSAVVETYASGEAVRVGDDLLVISAGEIGPVALAIGWHSGGVIDQRRLGAVVGASLRAAQPTLILRFDPGAVSAMPRICPGIAAALMGVENDALRDHQQAGEMP